MSAKPRYRYDWKRGGAVPPPSSPPPSRSVTGYDPTREVLPRKDDFGGWLLLGVMLGAVIGFAGAILLL